jgi:signal peptidase I
MIRRLFSKTIREAVAMRKHVQRLLDAQRDILSPQALGAVQAKITELNEAIASKANTGKIRIKTQELQFAAEKWVKTYPHAAWRENVEVLLVAIAVAMGIRTFFLQPFKIPTGSMQPTLYGVTSAPDFSQSKIDYWNYNFNPAKVEAELREQAKLRDELQIPTGLARIKEWFQGNSYIHVVAGNTGTVEIGTPVRFLIFNIMQKISVGGVSQTLWFPPDTGDQPLELRAGINPTNVYQKGAEVIKMRVSAGDHLFVNRLTYNFRKPERGEIVVFETKGISEEMRDRYRIPSDEFYIKRLTVLPDDRVQIGNDRHLIINGQRLDASTPHFENVYGFDPKNPPHESDWSGHVNGVVARQFDLFPYLAPLFPDGDTVLTNGSDTYMCMGDNTCNSLDSRSWGLFPTKYVIGKSSFVYWPITKRFGWGNQ